MPDYIAIGDIHGQDEQLAALLAQVPVEGTLVFLGDYLDRGPNVKGVLDRLMALARMRACIFLRGNHEDLALQALDNGPRAMSNWMFNGGEATLRSFGGALPPEYETFLRETRYYYATPDYIFVHGGLPPGQQPEAVDDPEPFLWMREPFLSSDYDWGRLVIHGHTPTPDRRPDIRPNRIDLDTGAIYGGPLTGLVLPEGQFLYAYP